MVLGFDTKDSLVKRFSLFRDWVYLRKSEFRIPSLKFSRENPLRVSEREKFDNSWIPAFIESKLSTMQQKASTSSEKPLLVEHAIHSKYTISISRKLCIGQDQIKYFYRIPNQVWNLKKLVSIFLIALFILQSSLDGVPFLKLSKQMDFFLNQI